MRRKPEFKRVDYHRYKKLRDKGWRRPRGIHNKTRKYKKGKFLVPKIGYSREAELRGMHPSGYFEVLVTNEKDLLKVDKDREAIRLSGRLGRRKKLALYAKAKELGIRVLNPPKEA